MLTACFLAILDIGVKASTWCQYVWFMVSIRQRNHTILKPKRCELRKTWTKQLVSVLHLGIVFCSKIWLVISCTDVHLWSVLSSFKIKYLNFQIYILLFLNLKIRCVIFRFNIYLVNHYVFKENHFWIVHNIWLSPKTRLRKETLFNFILHAQLLFLMSNSTPQQYNYHRIM